MNCPNCREDSDYNLVRVENDNFDGYVECNSCGKNIATFNITVVKVDL